MTFKLRLVAYYFNDFCLLGFSLNIWLWKAEVYSPVCAKKGDVNSNETDQCVYY